MIVNERLVTYLDSLTWQIPEPMQELEQWALQKEVPIIRRSMQSLLLFMLRLRQPKHVLEIGTAVGFSALLMRSELLPDATLEDELTLLWKREMITGCYMPSWCKLELDDGRTVNALVFIMDPRHPLYEADTRTQVIAPLIAAASGPLGTNAQYLFSLDQELTRLGMKDDCLNELVVKVKALLEGNPLNNTLRPGFA